jgi:hypothetical protein
MQGNAEKGAEEEERRRDEGPGEGAKEVAREEERRRMRWKMACYGGTDVMERSCAVARGKDINTPRFCLLCCASVSASG